MPWLEVELDQNPKIHHLGLGYTKALLHPRWSYCNIDPLPLVKNSYRANFVNFHQPFYGTRSEKWHPRQKDSGDWPPGHLPGSAPVTLYFLPIRWIGTLFIICFIKNELCYKLAYALQVSASVHALVQCTFKTICIRTTAIKYRLWSIFFATSKN